MSFRLSFPAAGVCGAVCRSAFRWPLTLLSLPHSSFPHEVIRMLRQYHIFRILSELRSMSGPLETTSRCHTSPVPAHHCALQLELKSICHSQVPMRLGPGAASGSYVPNHSFHVPIPYSTFQFHIPIPASIFHIPSPKIPNSSSQMQNLKSQIVNPKSIT